jgi:hypothetical protein
MKKVLAALLFVPLAANAGFYTGNTLLSKIRSDNFMDKSLALGYIMGVFDTGMNASHCPPNGVTAGQLNDLVKQVLEASPASRNMDADVLLIYTFKSAWPCKKGPGV